MAGPIIPNAFATAGLNTPGAFLDQDFEAIRVWIDDRNPAAGPIGSRPSPGNVGAIWVATDQFNLAYIDTGAAWVQIGYLATNLPGASSFVFDGIATPGTPAAGQGALFLPSSASGLRPLSWIDAGAQVSRFARILRNDVGNPWRDVNTTATETSIYSAPAPITSPPTIKGGTLGIDRILLTQVVGDILNNTGAARGFTLRYKYGGTTYGSIVTTGDYAASATRYGWDHWSVVVPLGATNAQFGRTVHRTSATANVNGGAGGSVGTQATSTHNGLTIDSTADQTLDITIQPEVNNANLSIRVFAVHTWVL